MYTKILAIINSCKNDLHIESCSNIINNYDKWLYYSQLGDHSTEIKKLRIHLLAKSVKL